MKKHLILLISLCYALSGRAQDHRVDPAESKVTWTGHAGTGAYSPRGSIKVASGQFTLIAGQLVKGLVRIDMNTLEQANKALESHLKKADFFDVGKYPAASFELVSAKAGRATGVLTIKGTAQTIDFPYQLRIGEDRLTLSAALKIDRTKYGIKYNSSSFFQDLGSYAIRDTFEMEILLVARR